ncbi:MAG: HAD family hydrolase [Dictyoglomus thermophilum]|nr:HAD family hydrolase [Dictyoglomus thermophilum]MCX7720799.1 HAD family hydrolase [Dictyoglomus thermophilum]
MELKGVIFDWDGTLVDSFSACIKATREIFNKFGFDISEEEYREKFSPNWYEIYRRHNIPEKYWKEIDLLWKDYFDYSLVKWREGAIENLTFLRDLNLKIGVVTASTKEDIKREKPHLHPEKYIDEWITWEDSQKPKPDPLPLLKILSKLKLSPLEVIYVGDTPEDIEMGKRVRIITIGIFSPFTPKEKLILSNPNFLLNDLFELLNFWKDLVF